MRGRRQLFGWTVTALAAASIAIASPPPTAPPPAAPSQTSNAPFAWQHLATDLASAIVGVVRAPQLAAVLPDSAVIHRFNSTDREAPAIVHDRLSGMTVVCVRTYVGIPQTLAADLAAAAAAKTINIPQAVRKELTPDSSSSRRANEIAAQWIHQTLNPSSTDLVGVILLYPDLPSAHSPTPALKQDDASYPPPLFLLVKGSNAKSPTVTRVVYGDPIVPGDQ